MRRDTLPAFEPFERRADADARIASALAAVDALLAADLLPAHRRELLSTCVWKVSLAEPRSKYATRFVSVSALASARSAWIHEHVYERAWLVHGLMSRNLEPADLPALTQACVVTREEHGTLARAGRGNPALVGWARYRVAAIAVVDRVERTWQVVP